MDRLEQTNSSVESTSPRLFAVDVPPQIDIYALCEISQQGLDEGASWFDEMHVGHKLRNSD